MKDLLRDIDEQIIKDDKIFVLVIYDIVNNRKRTQLEKFLRGYGFRVQKSAFEAYLCKNVYKQMVSKIGSYATDEDSIRVYKIFGKDKVLNYGKKVESVYEDIIII